MYERKSRFFSPIVDSLNPNFVLLFIMCSALVECDSKERPPRHESKTEYCHGAPNENIVRNH